MSLFSQSHFLVLAAKGPVEESMEEGLEDHPKAAKVKAAEKADDPASQAVGAKAQGRTMQSMLTTPASMEKARKERNVERNVLKGCRRQDLHRPSLVWVPERFGFTMNR